jgi:lipoprotein-anchoring transpeptidase ErfK/SrfK
MFLCLGTAALLLAAQWRTWISSPRTWMPNPRTESARAAGLLAQQTQRTTPAPATNGSRLVVDLSDRRVYVYRNQQLLASYQIAVGQDGWETPTGSFQVLHMQTAPKWRHPITGEVIPSGAQNPLGTRWIGFWTDGDAEIGFHGTNQEDSIGQAVSHGCLRMRNQDVESLYQQVSEGTLVTVQL